MMVLWALGPGAAAQESSPGFQPTLTVGGAAGTRFYAENWLQYPLHQEADGLLFADARGSWFTEGAVEGNLGLVWRQDLGQVLLGLYGYADLRRSETDHLYRQGTVGFDLLSENLEGRANLYIPIGPRENRLHGSQEARWQGNGLRIDSRVERALYGADVELGRRVPFLEIAEGHEARLFAGGYYFDAEEATQWYGGRLRADYRLTDLGSALPGARLALGGELRYGNDRDLGALASLRLSVPMGPTRTKPTGLRARLMDPVVRDIDIVTKAETQSETALLAINGQSLAQTTLITAEGGYARYQAVVTAAGEGAVIIADGSKGLFDNGAATLTLRPHQSLIGAGAAVRGARTGLMTQIPGQRPSFKAAPITTVILGSGQATIASLNAEVRSPHVSPPGPLPAFSPAIRVNNSQGARLDSLNVKAHGSAVTGLHIFQGTGAIITNNTVDLSGRAAYGIRLDRVDGSQTADNSVMVSRPDTLVSNNFSSDAIFLSRTRNSLVERNYIRNPSTPGGGVVGFAVDNLTIRANDVVMKGFEADAIRIDPILMTNPIPPSLMSRNILIENNRVESHANHSRTIFAFFTQNVTIQNNYSLNFGIDASRAIEARSSVDVRILGNTVASYGLTASAGIRTAGSDRVEISHNRILYTGHHDPGQPEQAWGGAITLGYPAIPGGGTITGVGNVWTGAGPGNACMTWGPISGGVELIIEGPTGLNGRIHRDVPAFTPGHNLIPITGNRVICKSP